MRPASAKVVALNKRPDGLAAPIVQRMLIRFKHGADPTHGSFLAPSQLALVRFRMRNHEGPQIGKYDPIKELGEAMRRYDELSNLFGKLPFYH